MLLIKRATGAVTGIARVVKPDEKLGLVFCWAFISKSAGEDYYDLHGDNIDGDFGKVVANTITVAAMARIWGTLLGGTAWVVEANERGGKQAERAADLVREGLVEARMPTPWNSVVRKAGFGRSFCGFAMFEQVLRRRADGRWVTASLEHRPQHTIEQWDKADEQWDKADEQQP